MTALASLPTLSVQIAFNPTNLQTLTQTWTDVTQWVRDFSTSSGRQHFLDRIESSTIRMTLDNRTGYFLNGTTNGTGAVIRTRLPIKVTATVGATTYPIFWGLTETAEERTADQLNQDIILTATDNTKYLSLLYMNRPNFYGNYCTTAYDQNYYPLGDAGATDLLSSNTGSIVGQTNNVAGALLYSTDTALDLTNGGSQTNVAGFNPFGASQTNFAGNSIDFWIVGQNAINQEIQIFNWSSAGYYLETSTSGEVQLRTAATNGAIAKTGVVLTDGLWHHIGVSAYTSGGTTYLSVYADGKFTQLGSASGTFPLTGFGIGNNGGYLYAYIDQVVVGKPTQTANNPNILQRWVAGSLLKNTVASGDRIAEVMVLSGFGSITSGAIAPVNFTVNDVAWTANSGTFWVQGLQSPATSSTALDLIQQVTDTDVGAFFQKPDGTFEFDTQGYLYTASNNATPSGANIWSDFDPQNGTITTFYEPSTFQVLRDDADVWTTVKITAQNGTVQTYENTANEPLYGYSTLTKSNVVSVTNEQANQEAIYLGNLYQSPLPRIGNVELRSETNNGANLVEMFKPYLNDQVLLQRTQNGASTTGTNPGAINSTMVIESIRHDFQADPGYWHSSFTLDPYPKRGQNSTPQTFFMLFDDATYGVFDSNNDYL